MIRFPGLPNRALCRQRIATAAMLLQSCVAHALNRGDGSRRPSPSARYTSVMKFHFFDSINIIFKHIYLLLPEDKIVTFNDNRQLIFRIYILLEAASDRSAKVSDHDTEENETSDILLRKTVRPFSFADLGQSKKRNILLDK